MIKDQEMEKGEEIISSSESEDSFEAVDVDDTEKEFITDKVTFPYRVKPTFIFGRSKRKNTQVSKEDFSHL